MNNKIIMLSVTLMSSAKIDLFGMTVLFLFLSLLFLKKCPIPVIIDF